MIHTAVRLSAPMSGTRMRSPTVPISATWKTMPLAVDATRRAGTTSTSLPLKSAGRRATGRAMAAAAASTQTAIAQAAMLATLCASSMPGTSP